MGAVAIYTELRRGRGLGHLTICILLAPNQLTCFISFVFHMTNEIPKQSMVRLAVIVLVSVKRSHLKVPNILNVARFFVSGGNFMTSSKREAILNVQTL